MQYTVLMTKGQMYILKNYMNPIPQHLDQLTTEAYNPFFMFLEETQKTCL